MLSNYSLLREAILNRRPVTALYSGYERHFCPHVLGMKRGEAQVLGFQFGGGSSTGLPPGGEWRCMKVHDLQQLMVITGPWYTGTSHSKPQTCIDSIDVEVSY
jgi:hypothetical protein